MNIVHAQRPDASVWFTVHAPVNFTKHWQMHNEASYRTLGVSMEPAQYFYRTGIRYTSREWSTAAGVAFFYTRTSFSKDNNEFGHEFRLWEEVNRLKQIRKQAQGQLRFRTEQRFFAATNIKAKYTAYRFRLKMGLTQKINDRWGIQLTEEYMQQLAHEKFIFDQNRLQFSGIYYLNSVSQLHAGYMWLRWRGDSQHNLTLSFYRNIFLHGA